MILYETRQFVFIRNYRGVKTIILIFISILFLTSCGSLTNFINNKNLEAYVCDHRWGCDASFTQSTDQYYTNRFAIAAEYYGLKHNIPLTVFDYRGRGSEQRDAFNMGRIDFGVYSYSCEKRFFRDPKSSTEHSIQVITDIRNGKKPTTVSYGCGIDNYKTEIEPYFLMGRNSRNTNDTTGFTYYGENLGSPQYTVNTHPELMSRPSTTRYFLMVKEDNSDRLEIVREHIRQCIENRGFFTDFSHWQAYHYYKIPMKELEIHFKNMSHSFESVNLYRGSFNDIAEYYFARESVNDVSAIKYDNKILIEINFSKKENIDYSLISVPVSIKIKLSGKKLSRYDFRSVSGGYLRKHENGDLILDTKIDFNNENLIARDTLIITEKPDYLNMSVPEIKLSGQKIISDQDIKITLFKKKIDGNEMDIYVCKRIFKWSTTHDLNITKEDGYEYYLGFINKTNNSGLVKWKQQLNSDSLNIQTSFRSAN